MIKVLGYLEELDSLFAEKMKRAAYAAIHESKGAWWASVLLPKGYALYTTYPALSSFFSVPVLTREPISVAQESRDILECEHASTNNPAPLAPSWPAGSEEALCILYPRTLSEWEHLLIFP